MKKFLLTLYLLLLLCGCSSSPEIPSTAPRGEYIYRRQDEQLFPIQPQTPSTREAYPWEKGKGGAFPKITKEFFRCKGSGLNPLHTLNKGTETLLFYDCGGTQRHSLPLRDQKEFIYPILIDLLNYLQETTGKRVVITCGHACPEHNSYLDPSPANQASKHMIGAEVDFYLQGMEDQPQQVVDLLQRYYREQPKYASKPEYLEFKRYEKTSISTQPWYNKEIFIKLVKKTEGRDFDNRHSYPYVTIQVRHDWDLNEKVNYSWDQAFRNFHRW